MEYGFLERVAEDLGSTGAVDPELFVEACVELEVWDDAGNREIFETMIEWFEDSAISATHRWYDVGSSLHDGTLAELLASNDDGQVIVPNAVFYAAATVPMDEETFDLDRREWYLETMRILTETGQATRLDG